MTRPIESVVAEAQQRLESSGQLDVAAFIAAYPDRADELGELLPVMVAVHSEKQWQAAAERSKVFGVSLFSQLSAPAESTTEGQRTVADLFAEDRALSGMSLEAQARRSGLPLKALEQLTHDHTPVTRLSDNAALGQLAVQVTAPLSALVKEVRRLLALQALGGMKTGTVFTRDSETSTDVEREALRDKVREAARKPPEEQ